VRAKQLEGGGSKWLARINRRRWQVASGRSVGEPRRLVEVTLVVGAMVRIHCDISPATIGQLVARFAATINWEGAEHDLDSIGRADLRRSFGDRYRANSRYRLLVLGK
jgi:hypothetical protein